jgi:hypothetical protein
LKVVQKQPGRAEILLDAMLIVLLTAFLIRPLFQSEVP